MGEEVHAGHRDRLRKKFIMHGIDIFEDHEILELLLFYVIPRKNTNELAHKLLKEFGTIPGIMEAPLSSLKMIEGIGENVACFIKLILTMVRVYMERKEVEQNTKPTREDFTDKLSRKFLGRKEETIAIMLLDAKCKILYEGIVSKGTFNRVELHIRRIMELIVLFDAAAIIVGHNHPSGLATPSQEDVITTQKLEHLFNTMNIEFIDHIIVADGDYVSLKECKIKGLFGN